MLTKETARLAIFGGKPAFKEKLYVSRPSILNRGRLIQRIHDILDRRWFTNDGPYAQVLERKLQDFLGVKHCVVMSSGTSALEVAVRALGLSGEVLLPSMTFIATAHALQWSGLQPVFCDIDPVSWCLDPEKLEAKITPKTCAILGVHLFGRTCDTEQLEVIARKHSLKLIFDAAHAFACSRNGRFIGGFGHVEVFSFHATKFFQTAEGGAAATNDDELADKIRAIRQFGQNGSGTNEVVGINAKLSELHAAIGLSSFETMDHILHLNREIYEGYRRELAGIPGISLMNSSGHGRSNYQFIVLAVNERHCPLNRDQFLKILAAENVVARPYFYPPCHQTPPYGSPRIPDPSLPLTERLSARLLTLPGGAAVSMQEITQLCQLIRTAVQHAPEIQTMLKAETCHG